MKKKLFFLIILCALFIGKNVYAEEAKFYEAEYIDNIYMSKMSGTQRSTIRYQKARFFRQVGTDDYAYCIEPEATFLSNQIYNSTSLPYNLSQDQVERIKKLGYYGYMYSGHEDPKWYAITQFMIWKTADPYGLYYFTDGLNGNKITAFESEMNEIESLVNKDQLKPSFNNVPTIIKEGDTIEINDNNNILSEFTTNIGTISNNKLILANLKEGEYKITLTRKKHNGRNVKFFENTYSQNLFINGNLDDTNYSFNFTVLKTKLNIKKIDSESKNSNPIGKATVIGTKYNLYDEDDNLVKELIIDEDGKAEVENLNFGKYYLKEKEAGLGYNIDSDKYEINISKENPKVEITLEDEIIKKDIIIHKTYGDTTFTGEANVIFDIYNDNNEIIDKIVTDENGYAKINLTYGKYILRQVNSKEGYKLNEDITLEILDNETLNIELKDYKIKVPNTYTKRNILLIILRLFNIICLNISLN